MQFAFCNFSKIKGNLNVKRKVQPDAVSSLFFANTSHNYKAFIQEH